MRHFPTLLTASAAAIVLAIASAARAEPPKTSPPTDELEEPDYPPPSTRWKVAGVGLASAAVFYGAGAGLSYAYPDTLGMKDLRIPVAGPWIGIAHNGCVPSDGDCTTLLVTLRSILMALDGLAQAGSLAVVVEGWFMPTQRAPALAPLDKPAPPSGPPPAKPGPGGDKNLFFVPTPMTIGAGGIGVGVVGRF